MYGKILNRKWSSPPSQFRLSSCSVLDLSFLTCTNSKQEEESLSAKTKAKLPRELQL
jgi:hypothetical protein